MFNFSMAKIILITALILFLVRSDDLPVIMRSLARFIQYVRFYRLKINNYFNNFVNDIEIQTMNHLAKENGITINNEEANHNLCLENNPTSFNNSWQNYNKYLTEIKYRLIYFIVTFVLIFCLCFFYANNLINILLFPFETAYLTYSQTSLNVAARLIYLAPFEYLINQLNVSFAVALVISLPFFIWHVANFLSPALYVNEKFFCLVFAVASIILFIVGGLIVYFILMPAVIFLALNMQQLDGSTVNIEYLANVSSYIDLLLRMIVVFGLIFQLPIILLLLIVKGILTVNSLVKLRKYVILVIFIVAAIVTPPDLISQITLALPAILLYEITILIAKRFKK
ncbi:twin-arginine translocase subunit TatC [Bartonella sp. DGB1]|uniref:twin-arginine translocase subunit TatC n=1 Tax=Bartonella sp. DGB1 TaxID=3239807 RepID=UPI003523C071